MVTIIYNIAFVKRVEFKYSHQKKKQICEVIDVLMNLIGKILSHCVYVYILYIYTLIKTSIYTYTHMCICLLYIIHIHVYIYVCIIYIKSSLIITL